MRGGTLPRRARPNGVDKVSSSEEFAGLPEETFNEVITANGLLNEEIAERKRAEGALELAEEKYRSIFENAIEGIFQSTPDGRFISANPALARMFGYDSPEQLIAEHTNLERHHYVDPQHRTEFKLMMAERGVAHALELEVYRKDGSRMWTSENTRAVHDANGAVLYYEGIVEDITERKQTEQELREQKEILQSTFDHVPVMLRVVSKDGQTRMVNQEWERTVGWTLQEIKKEDLDIVALSCPDPDKRQRLSAFISAATGKWADFKTTVRDGRVIDTTWAYVRLSDGTAIGIGQDITEQKQVERDRIRLFKGLVKAQEDEQLRLSRELHDHVAQLLAALNLGLKSVTESAQLGMATRDRLRQLGELTSQLGLEVHNLARDLRPMGLEDLGLQSAVSEYTRDWSHRSKIQADFHSNGLIKDHLPQYIETAVYRIVQEAMANILKHSQARNVSILLEYRDNRLKAIIEDDGRGFDVEAVMSGQIKKQRLGLLGMRERVTLVGGSLEIESAPDAGTTVIVQLPVPPDWGEEDRLE